MSGPVARAGLGLAARTAPYRAVLGSRVRAQRSYRASFRLDLASSLLVGLVELAEIWVLFRSAGTLGGPPPGPVDLPGGPTVAADSWTTPYTALT